MLSYVVDNGNILRYQYQYKIYSQMTTTFFVRLYVKLKTKKEID